MEHAHPPPDGKMQDDDQPGPPPHVGMPLNAEDLRSILDDAGICTWVLDIPTGRVTVSQTCAALFGVPAEELDSMAAFQALVHPEDRKARSDAIRHALEHGGTYEVDYRAVHPDGHPQWLRSRGTVQVGPDGTPFRHRGVVTSIHEHRRTCARSWRPCRTP